MNENQERARQNRQRNQETKAALYAEKATAVRAARQALQRVFECADATPEQILEAARLLTQIAGR